MKTELQYTLPDLATQINLEHEACLGAAREAITRAIEVGRLLCEAKEQIPHGGWASWVEANCSFGDRQASKYMRAYHHRDQIGTTGSDLVGLHGVIDALASPKADRNQIGTSGSDFDYACSREGNGEPRDVLPVGNVPAIRKPERPDAKVKAPPMAAPTPVLESLPAQPAVQTRVRYEAVLRASRDVLEGSELSASLTVPLADGSNLLTIQFVDKSGLLLDVTILAEHARELADLMRMAYEHSRATSIG